MWSNRLFNICLAPCLVALAFLSSSVQAEDAPAQSVRYASLTPLLAQIQAQDSDSENITHTISDIISLTADIDDYVAAGKIKATPDLQRSIESYRNIIVSLLARDNEEERYAALQRIRDDAKLKWNYVDTQAGISAFARSMHVLVSIKTVRKGSPAPGYSVACFSLDDLDFRPNDPTYPFGSDTNNAVADMMPGLYDCRLSKGGKFVMKHALKVGTAKGASQGEIFDVSNF